MLEQVQGVPQVLIQLCPSGLFLMTFVMGEISQAGSQWFAIPFSSGPHSVRTLRYDLSVWVALHGMAHSFFELDKAVVHVIRLISFL